MAQSPAFATATAESPAPDGAQSPPPQGIHGDLENEMLGLANALYNLGTTVVLDSTKEKQNLRPGENPPAKPVAQKVNEVIGHLANIEELSTGYDTMIPFQILQYVRRCFIAYCSIHLGGQRCRQCPQSDVFNER